MMAVESAQTPSKNVVLKTGVLCVKLMKGHIIPVYRVRRVTLRTDCITFGDAQIRLQSITSVERVVNTKVERMINTKSTGFKVTSRNGDSVKFRHEDENYAIVDDWILAIEQAKEDYAIRINKALASQASTSSSAPKKPPRSGPKKPSRNSHDSGSPKWQRLAKQWLGSEQGLRPLWSALCGHPGTLTSRSAIELATRQYYFSEIVVDLFAKSFRLECVGCLTFSAFSLATTQFQAPQMALPFSFFLVLWGGFDLLCSILNLDIFALFFALMRLSAAALQCFLLANYWLAVLKESGSRHEFYINFSILNKAEAIKLQTQKTLPCAGKLVPGIFGSLVGNVVTDDFFCSQVADMAIESIPEALSDQGIQAITELVLQKGKNYVLKITIQKVNILTLVTGVQGAETAQTVQQYLSRLPKWAQNLVNGAVPLLVTPTVMNVLPNELVLQMKEVGDVKVAIKSFQEAGELAGYIKKATN